MDIINQYTNYLTHLNVNIPTTFNYPYFFLGIKSILESDHSFAISKVLMNLFSVYWLYTMLITYFLLILGEILVCIYWVKRFLNYF